MRAQTQTFLGPLVFPVSHSSPLSLPTSSHRPVRRSNPASISKRGDNLRRSPVGRSIAITFCAGLFATPAFAQMTCAALGGYLATQPNISQFVPPPPAAQVPVPFTTLVPATSTPPNAARCEANFVYSAKGGLADGYAVGQNQRIGIRVGFPLNTMDGGSGGVQGAWNGKVRNIGGGGLQGTLGNANSMAPATNTGYVGSIT